MKKLIIGLGNPGEKYKNTRHNAGFLFIDSLLETNKVEKQGKLKNSHFYKLDNGLLLIKPNTFMNKNGLAVKEATKWFDIEIEKDLIIVHDDLDIPLGKCKFQFAKSPRDHNGIKSVEDHLGTTKFYRIRIGIDNRKDRNIDGEKYVLNKFSSEELIILNKEFPRIILGLVNQV